MPKVSVVVPVYNTEKYLHYCIDALSAQTLEDIEIIFVDNGSTDASGVILDTAAKKDARIAVIHEAKNSNAGEARNRGLEFAKGEYLSILDSDDFFEPCMLEHAYEKAKKMTLMF